MQAGSLRKYCQSTFGRHYAFAGLTFTKDLLTGLSLMQENSSVQQNSANRLERWRFRSKKCRLRHITALARLNVTMHPYAEHTISFVKKTHLQAENLPYKWPLKLSTILQDQMAWFLRSWSSVPIYDLPRIRHHRLQSGSAQLQSERPPKRFGNSMQSARLARPSLRATVPIPHPLSSCLCSLSSGYGVRRLAGGDPTNSSQLTTRTALWKVTAAHRHSDSQL